MDLEAFVRSVRHYCKAGGDPQAVREALGQLVLSEELLSRFERFDDHDYSRNVIGSDEEFELVLACWLPGQHSSIHDHGESLCAVRLVRGSLVNRTFTRSDRGEPSRPVVRCTGEGPVGEAGLVTAPRDSSIHQITNRSAQPAVSLHFYAPPVKEYQMYDEALDTNSTVTREFAGVPVTFSAAGADAEHIPSKIGTEGGRGLVEYCRERRPRRVLDVGSGAGHFSILAGLLGAEQVVALDLNEHALQLTPRNWRLNGLDPRKLRVVPSDLFAALDEHAKGTFDLIISNPPQLPTAIAGPSDRNNHFFYSGYDGRAVLDPLIRQARDYLRPGGALLLTGRSHNGWAQTGRLLDEVYGPDNWHTTREVDVPFTIIEEDIVEYMLERQAAESEPRIFRVEEGGGWYHRLSMIVATRAD